MKRAILVAAILLLAGCGGSAKPSDEGFLRGLKDQGLSATSPVPQPPGVFEVSSTEYHVPGGQLHIFTFANVPQAENAAGRIEPDGYMVKSTSGINQAIDWPSPPHWFRQGREIGLYLGTTPKVIDALSTIAGPQIAGS